MEVEVVVFVYTEVGAEGFGSREKKLRQMYATEAAHRHIVAHWYLEVEAMRLLVIYILTPQRRTYWQRGTGVLVEPYSPRGCIRTTR